MILDEPTNHLDRSAKRWLLDELARFPGALLVVSHDLKLLDHSITKVLHISNQRLTEWKGNYSKFQAQHEADQSQRERAVRARAARDQAALHAGRLHAGQHREAGAQGQVARQAGRAAGGDPHPGGQARAGQQVQAARATALGAVPLEVAKLGVRYGSNEVLADVTFHAGRGDHIVVIGRNGAGKSSLLRCLAGVQEPTNGVVELGANVVLGYFAQEHEQIDPDLTALANVSDAVLKRSGTAGRSSARSACPPRRPTSCPRRSRAASGPSSAWPCCRPARPTCCCSTSRPTTSTPSSIVAVGAMLGAWPGTIVAVSHERGFVEALRPDLLPPAPRGALHPLARGVPRRRGDALASRARDRAQDVHPDLGRPQHALVEGDRLGGLRVVGLAKFCTFGLAMTAQVSRASHR